MSSNAVVLVDASDNPYGTSLVSVKSVHRRKPEDLVELAQQIQRADDFTKAVASSKLTVIAEQMRFLQSQARKVLEDVKRDNDLNHVACNMKKIPGNIYFLYRRKSGQRYFSLLSPQEWGSSCPNEYLGTFKLEADMSWTPEEDIDSKHADLAVIDKLLNTSNYAAITQ